MRRTLLACTVALALAARAATAAASGIDLAWDTCAATLESGNLNSTCDTNDPEVTHRLVMVFRTGFALPDLGGVSMTLEISAQHLEIPDWWRFGPGECREGSFTFPGYTTSLGATCQNPWAGHFTGGGFAVSMLSATRVRVTMDLATPDSLEVMANTRYVAGTAVLDMARTYDDGMGGPVCSGCATPACVLLTQITVIGHAPGEDYELTNQDWRQYVTWQGAAGGLACWVPTRNATWGAIKAMYR